MDLSNLQQYLIPALFVAFLGWRFFRFRAVKGKIPALIRQGAIVVDVRSAAEFKGGAREGSVNIPLNELSSRAGKLDRSKTIVLCCASGTRSGMAAVALRKMGFKDVVNAGPWTNTVV